MALSAAGGAGRGPQGWAVRLALRSGIFRPRLQQPRALCCEAAACVLERGSAALAAAFGPPPEAATGV